MADERKMNDLDELFRKAKKLEAPDTLWKKVSDGVSETQREKPAFSLGETVKSIFAPVWVRAAVPLAVTAAAIAIVIRLSATTTVPEIYDAETIAAVNEAISEAYGENGAFAEHPSYAANGLAKEDINEFINEQLNEIYRINGGDNNA